MWRRSASGHDGRIIRGLARHLRDLAGSSDAGPVSCVRRRPARHEAGGRGRRRASCSRGWTLQDAWAAVLKARPGAKIGPKRWRALVQAFGDEVEGIQAAAYGELRCEICPRRGSQRSRLNRQGEKRSRARRRRPTRRPIRAGRCGSTSRYVGIHSFSTLSKPANGKARSLLIICRAEIKHAISRGLGRSGPRRSSRARRRRPG